MRVSPITTVRTLYRRLRYGTTDPDRIACIRTGHEWGGPDVAPAAVARPFPAETRRYKCTDCGATKVEVVP